MSEMNAADFYAHAVKRLREVLPESIVPTAPDASATVAYQTPLMVPAAPYGSRADKTLVMILSGAPVRTNHP